MHRREMAPTAPEPHILVALQEKMLLMEDKRVLREEDEEEEEEDEEDEAVVVDHLRENPGFVNLFE